MTLDQLEIKPRGHLPNNATKLVLHGIKYQGAELDITIDSKMYEIFVRAQSTVDTIHLAYEHGSTHGFLRLDDRLSFPIDTPLFIRRSEPFCS